MCGALCYLAACNWATVDELTRLEKRTAIAYHAAQTHVERGEAVAIVVDDSVILSNTDGAKFDARYDASTDRELLASLVANRDLKLWERATSYVVRGRMAAASSRSKCTGCAFLRQTGNPGSPFCDQYCHADLQTICKDRGMGCSDYYPRAALSRRTSERFVVVKAQDIWRVTPDDAAETDSVVPEAK
ncbi:hypothetical protein Alches_25950 [Alicyclobacillus hesperidum subsp. aegles]|nr:hypothetical protein AAC03nite_32780 [Alicyclobacillus acidoterrestris]GLG02554.1 hypothetical protein Alches_25950 [Alicyclobacillus hesperidum subsp. aegles]